MVSKETIIEFQQAIKKDYGKDVSLEEASQMLTDLIGYFDKLAEIYNKNFAPKNGIINPLN